MEKPVKFATSGITELGKEELHETNGGWIRILTFYLAALALEAVTEGLDKCIEDFKEGFEEGYNN